VSVRYKLVIEYDGTGFVGWQSQTNGLSVQFVLEGAALAFTGLPCPSIAAGRTDAGVHALGQVAHLDLPRAYPAQTVRDAINFHMKPHPVAVRTAREAPPDFHARFSARERRYLYRILNRNTPPVLDRHRVWWVSHALDEARMAEAATHLVGRHDFSTFRASQCQAKSAEKTLEELVVTREREEIHIRARARSFLHHQVRNMVGSLKWVGEGKWTPDDLRQALEARDRTAGGPTAPAEGLYLTDVIY